MANRIGKNKALMSSFVLSCCTLILFLAALSAIEQGDIWNFLLCCSCVLMILLSPKDQEYFKTKISNLNDLNKLEFHTDPLTAAFLTIAQLMMVAGMLGNLLFGQ
jgi:hypothetical protein